MRQTRPPDSVIVVDNASSDDSPALVTRSYPKAQLMELPRNVGFPAACNAGIQATRSDLVAILNNDLVLDPRWLESLLEHYSKEWSLWASLIVFASAPDTVDSAGDGMAVIGAGYKRGHGESASQYKAAKEVFGPCAAAALYRRELLEEVGGFDEDFFLVYEDADLNFRARLLGRRCLYVPDAVVKHRVNTSIGQFSDLYVYQGHRNSEFVFWKCLPMPMLLAYLPERILFDLLSALYFSFRGRGPAFLRGKIDFLRNWKQVRAKRKEVQAARTVSWQELRRHLDRNWFRFRRKAGAGS